MSNPSHRARRILIVGVNWLGDILFMTPAIRAIRRAYPDAHLACMVPPRGLDLLTGNPHLNEIISMSEARGLRGLLQFFPLVRRLRKEKFDTVFFFHRSFSRVVAAWSAGIPVRIGYRTWKQGWLLTQAVKPLSKDSVHKVIWFLNLLHHADIPSDGMHYDLVLSQQDEQTAQALLEEWKISSADRIVTLHPGANWNLKRWPAQNFARLADEIAIRFRAKVIFVGGPEDLPLVRQITARMKTEPLTATGRTTFRQSGALLKRSSVFITNDSGPLHLGLAVGAPVVALFGPTVSQLSGPLNGSKSVTLVGSIGCPVPCYQLRCPANLCMEQIRVEQVLQAAEQFL